MFLLHVSGDRGVQFHVSSPLGKGSIVADAARYRVVLVDREMMMKRLALVGEGDVAAETVRHVFHGQILLAKSPQSLLLVVQPLRVV